MKKIYFILSFVIIAFLLASCVTILQADATVSIDQNENWKVKYDMVFLGQEFADYKQSFDDSINSFKSQARQQGVSVDVKELPVKDGNNPYEMTLTGKGVDVLNSMLGREDIFVKRSQDGETVYSFSMFPTDLYTGELYIGGASALTFTIEGVEVVDSNGKITGNSVTWQNPVEEMNAMIKPQGSVSNGFPLWLIPVIIGGMLVITFVILLVTGVFKKKPQPAYGYPQGYGTPGYPPPPPAAGGQFAAPPPVPGMVQQVPPVPPTMPPAPPVLSQETMIMPPKASPAAPEVPPVQFATAPVMSPPVVPVQPVVESTPPEPTAPVKAEPEPIPPQSQATVLVNRKRENE